MKTIFFPASCVFYFNLCVALWRIVCGEIAAHEFLLEMPQGGAVAAPRPKLAAVFRIAAAASNAVNMASALGRLARLSALRTGLTSRLTPSSGPGRTVTPGRTAVCTPSGAILPKPKKVSAAFKARVWRV